MNDKKYWVMLGEQPKGPFSLYELSGMNISSNTPVWYSGLSDWVAASALAELRPYLNNYVTPPPVPDDYCNPNQQYNQYNQGYYQQGYNQPNYNQHGYNQAFNQPDYNQQRYNPYNQGAPQPRGPMPNTYLAWCIITMLLCCIPTGIVSLIYSLQVSNKYAAGDMAGAEKASRTTEIWLIITIVLGLVGMPFQLIYLLF